MFLREKGEVRVALVTPYGATKSEYSAVSKVHKLDTRLGPVAGKVGHHRIQQGRANESIGEAIRAWFRLPPGSFERIDIEIEIIDDVFYVTPLTYKLSGSTRFNDIERPDRPLTFTKRYASPLWLQQLEGVEKKQPGIVGWALREICRVVEDHRPQTKVANVQESDLLRASGPLALLGVFLGPHCGRGYDCVTTKFTFLNFRAYTVPVEIKKNSEGFKYQQKKYGKDELSRAVVLCALHTHKNLHRHIDVIELDALCAHAEKFPLTVTA